MQQKVGDFLADDGQVFTIYEQKVFVRTGIIQNPHTTIPGLKRLSTSQGLPVTDNGDGTYTIVPLGLKVCRMSEL
jgi:hypothetical protein